MNEITQMLAQKFNLAPETAQEIVTFLLQQVKGKLPEGLASHVDGLLASGAAVNTSEGGLLDAVKGMASNLMGKA